MRARARQDGCQKRRERELASLTVVIGTKEHTYVLNGDREGDCPQHEGQRTKNMLGIRGKRVTVDLCEKRLECVNRRSADVSENNAEGGDGQCKNTL